MIYYIDISKIGNFNKLYQKYYNLLESNELNNFSDILFERNKKLLFCSKILQKYIISKERNIKYCDISIKKNKYGKPFFKNLEYNVSHDNNIVMMMPYTMSYDIVLCIML